MGLLTLRLLIFCFCRGFLSESHAHFALMRPFGAEPCFAERCRSLTAWAGSDNIRLSELDADSVEAARVASNYYELPAHRQTTAAVG